jgi:hypothetical protein
MDIIASFAGHGEIVMIEIAKLDQAWEAINVLGGSPEQNNSYDQGFVDAIVKALDEIEKLGGMDPKQRASTLSTPVLKATQNVAEGDPSVMPDSAGAGTFDLERVTNGPSETFMAVYDAIGDIETDDSGKCRWADVANIQRAVYQMALDCSDCPPMGYPTDKTRCAECPMASAMSNGARGGEAK